MPTTKPERLQRILSQLRRCVGSGEDPTTTARRRALDYYFQRPESRDDSEASNVIAGTLTSMVEATLAQVVPAFAADGLMRLHPIGGEDEDQAQLETDVCLYMVMSANQGVTHFGDAFKDALLGRNGAMKVYVDERRYTDHRTFVNVEPLALSALMDQPNKEVTLIRYDEREKQARLRIEEVRREFKAEHLPISDLRWPQEWGLASLALCPFVAERHVTRREDMIAEGFPRRIVEDLPRWNGGGWSAFGRLPGVVPQPRVSIDEGDDEIEWFECYILNGPRRIRIDVHERTILREDEADRVPYALGSVFRNPGSSVGISLWDKLAQQQDIETDMTRGVLDSITASVRSRFAVLDGHANADDISSGDPGKPLRISGVEDIRQAVTMLSGADITQGLLGLLDYQRIVRSELGGASLQLSTGEMQLASDRVGSQGVDRAYSVMEQLSALMTRNFAESLVREVFSLTHETLRANPDVVPKMRQRAEWVAPDANNWPRRTVMTVRPGLSKGRQAEQAATLQALLSAQLQLAERGMDRVLVDVEHFHKTLLDWLRASNIQHPESYVVDPRSDESKQAQAEKQEAERVQAEMRRRFTAEAVENERLKNVLKKYEADLDRYKSDADRIVELYLGLIQQEGEQAKLVEPFIRQVLTSQGITSNGTADAESTDTGTADAGAAESGGSSSDGAE